LPVRAVPGRTGLRFDGGDLLDAGLKRRRQRFQQSVTGQQHGRLIKALGCIALLAALLALLVSHTLNALVWLSSPLKIAPTSATIASAFGVVARAFGTLGVVAERGVERAWVGGGADVRDLFGSDADADHRWPVLPGRVGRGGAG
jgi:hypothetical protein